MDAVESYLACENIECHGYVPLKKVDLSSKGVNYNAPHYYRNSTKGPANKPHPPDHDSLELLANDGNHRTALWTCRDHLLLTGPSHSPLFSGQGQFLQAQ